MAEVSIYSMVTIFARECVCVLALSGLYGQMYYGDNYGELYTILVNIMFCL